MAKAVLVMDMPDADDLGAEYVMGTRDGWNACLEEITGNA